MSAYIVIHNTVHDPEAMDRYVPAAVPAILEAGGEVLVVDEGSEVLEGATDHLRTIVIRFPSREAAEAFYRGPAYAEVLPIRLGATTGFGVLVDGLS